MKKIIHLVVGARPNFMKIAPLYHALKTESWAAPLLVHTGQHSSALMSDAFIRDLDLPAPDHFLGAQGAGHAAMTAAVMVAYEKLLTETPPDCLIVPGDVNSTLAACLCAKKMNIHVVHVEAGLRSFDRTMPEEQNRIVVDALSDTLWTPSADADDNLSREGIVPERIERIGNVMIDAYTMLREKILRADTPVRLGLDRMPYGVVTLHRPSNVDSPDSLRAVAGALNELGETLDLVFPVHPRTARTLETAGLRGNLASGRLKLIEPLGYVEFMSLVEQSALVVTDSGGLQEEAAHIGVPCLTLRNTTERPITLAHGNRLTSPALLLSDARDALSKPLVRKPIPLWDGNAAKRGVAHLRSVLE